MSGQCIVAEFDSSQKARTAMDVLALNGYREKHVSYLARSDAPELRLLQEMSDESQANMGSGTGVAIGSALGGALAAPLAASTLIGPFILVGPLVGIGLGAALGGFLGFSKTLDKTDENAAPNYRDRIEQGGILILGIGRDSDLRDMEALLKTADPRTLKRYDLPDPQKDPNNELTT